jgi:hypothetical protein
MIKFRQFHMGWLPLLVGVAVLLGIFIATAYQPVVDLHGFRQTQTALSVWAMAHDGPLLAYETPVLGVPWQVPFEFPAFQWIALLLWKLSGQSIEFSGRLASVAAALVSIWPIYRLARRVSPEPLFAPCLAAVIITAPAFAFWARAYMIETTALLFALGWLSLLLDMTERPTWTRGVAALLLGCLAAAIKITTFVPFFGFGMLLVAWQAYQLQPPGLAKPRQWVSTFLLFALPLVAGLAWTAYADQLKATAPLAQHLTSDALHGWTFGTVADRTSSAFLGKMLFTRPLAVLGPLLVALPLLMLAALARSRRLFVLGGLCLCVYFGGFVLFAKLYRIHDYYHVAVAPFLCAAVVIALWSITGQKRRKYFLLGVLVLQLSQVGYLFGSKYGGLLAKDGWNNSLVRAGRFARSVTTEGDGILVIGTDWTPAIPFYAERHAVALPTWVTVAQLRQLFDQPRAFFGDAPLSLAIRCTYRIDQLGPNKRQLIEAYFKGLEKIPNSRFGACESYYVR